MHWKDYASAQLEVCCEVQDFNITIIYFCHTTYVQNIAAQLQACSSIINVSVNARNVLSANSDDRRMQGLCKSTDLQHPC